MAIKPAAKPAFKLMNATLPVFVLHLHAAEVGTVLAGLRARFASDPDFFSATPVVLSLAQLAASDALPDFAALCAGLREMKLAPIGVMDASPAQCAAALAMGLAKFEDRAAKSKVGDALENPPSVAPAPTETSGQAELGLDAPTTALQRPAVNAKLGAGETARNAPARPPALVIDKPVRSGQRIYAEGRDLVVLAMVSAGAELIADGDIHVYAPLRGRALAGARGESAARIYTQCMGAELVSIAGHFKVLEDVPAALKGKPAQVRLDGEKVVMQALE